MSGYVCFCYRLEQIFRLRSASGPGPWFWGRLWLRPRVASTFHRRIGRRSAAAFRRTAARPEKLKYFKSLNYVSYKSLSFKFECSWQTKFRPILYSVQIWDNIPLTLKYESKTRTYTIKVYKYYTERIKLIFICFKFQPWFGWNLNRKGKHTLSKYTNITLKE